MSHCVTTAWRQKLALIKVEDHLLRQAAALYQMGPWAENIRSSQMAAVDEKIQEAPSIERAQKDLEKFLEHQMGKQERRGQQEGWLSSSRTPTTSSLGEILLDWLSQEKYLAGLTPVDENLDRLAALRRFWANFFGHYRYRLAVGKDMNLKEG